MRRAARDPGRRHPGDRDADPAAGQPGGPDGAGRSDPVAEMRTAQRGPSPRPLRARVARPRRHPRPHRVARGQAAAHVEPWSSYVVLPLFAFANAGVVLSIAVIEGHERLMLAIVAGLVVGKSLGMSCSAPRACASAWPSKPDDYNWRQLAGAAHLPGSASPCRCSSRPGLSGPGGLRCGEDCGLHRLDPRGRGRHCYALAPRRGGDRGRGVRRRRARGYPDRGGISGNESGIVSAAAVAATICSTLTPGPRSRRTSPERQIGGHEPADQDARAGP